MVNSKCQSIKDQIGRYFSENVFHEQSDDVCAVTLPILTSDGRATTVFIESRAGNYFLIHDGGKTANELDQQGVKLTQKVSNRLSELAAQYSLSYSDETLQWAGKGDLIPHIFALAACSVAASMFFLDHEMISEQRVPLRDQLGAAVRRWAKKKASVKPSVRVAGNVHQHSFDYVAYPAGQVQPIALSIVTPTVSALDAAERYGFKSKDLVGTPYEPWRMLVIQDRAEQWSNDAARIIERCSSGVVPVRSDEDLSSEAISARLSALIGSGTPPRVHRRA